MKKYVFELSFPVLLLLLVFPFNIRSQYSLEHSRAYGGSLQDNGRAIAIDPNNFFVTGGPSFSSDLWVPKSKGGSDFGIMQHTATGDTIWSRTYGGSNNDDLNAITYNSSGGIAAFGTTRSNGGDIGNNPAIIGAWLLSLDAAGEKIFSRVYAGDLGEQGIDIMSLADGYALLVQSTSPELEGAENNGNFDVWLARTNNIGTVNWATFWGGTDADIPTGFARTSGGIVISAYSNSIDGDVIGNHGGFDYWVFFVNLEGEFVWGNSFGGSGDDRARDIAVADDGSIYVVGESESTDGDKTQWFGRDDLWIIKLDPDGNLLWQRTLGGTEDDSGTQVEVLSDGTVVIAGNTKSDDVYLNSNKGRTDGWVLLLDEDGNILQSMNYGGSEDDYCNSLAVDGNDRFWINGNTSSTNGNLSLSEPPGVNSWLMRFQSDTIPCTINEDCFTDELTTGIIQVPTAEGPVCTNSCNVGTSGGPFGQGCFGFQGRTTWFKIRTDSTAEQLTVTVTSAEFNYPQIAVFQSASCLGFESLGCDIGEDGVAQVVNVDVDPDTAYFVVVGSAEGLAGDFTLCASVLDLEFCNKAPLLYVNNTSMGSPPEGPYLPGEEVQFCYEVPVWDKIECNGIQGIQPSFGPGWDTLNFNIFGMPKQIDTMLVPVAEGSWDWYALGGVSYNFTNPHQGYFGGQGLPPGWYFTNTDDPPPNENPDQTTGDIVTCLDDSTSWKVCWTLQTYEFCQQDLDCSVSVKSFADGEIGSQVSQACQYDGPITHEATLKCCLNPFLNPITNKIICSGDTVLVFFDSNLEPPVTYTYEVVTFGNVVGASSGQGGVLQQQLFNFGDEIASVTYIVTGTSDGCTTPEQEFSVVIRPIPRASMSLVGPDTVCQGDDIDIRFSYIGNPPYFNTIAINGIPQEQFVFEETPAILTIQLEETSQLTFIEFNDVFCPGNTTGTFTVHVKDPVRIDTLTFLCPGDTVYIADRKFTVPGEYEVILENAAQNGCDSVVNLTINPLFPTSVFMEHQICVGDTFKVGDSDYTESGVYEDTLVAANGCDSIVTLALTVTNSIIASQNLLVCFGDTVEFRGQKLTQSGTYRDTVPQSVQCDSIYVLNLTALPNIILTETVIVPDSAGLSNGSISIQVDGGLPPYRFLWNTGDTTSSLTDIPTGDYSVTVTDFAGCTSEFDFFVVSSLNNPIAGLDQVRIYPNPVAVPGTLVVRFSNSNPDLGNLILRVISTDGKMILAEEHSAMVGEQRFGVQLGDIARGMYFLTITDMATGNTIIESVVVR